MHERSLAAFMAVALLACLASSCGSGGSGTRSTNLERPGPPLTYTPPTFPTPETPATPATPATTEPSPTPSPTRAPTPYEPELTCPRRALLGVYSPQRLHVIARCVWFVGYVARIVQLRDGDVRFDMIPARGYGRFLNDVNRSAQHGQFVAVIILGQPMAYLLTDPGQRLAVLGTLVRNVAGGWNEMHPVWEVRFPGSGTLIYAIPPDPPLHNPG